MKLYVGLTDTQWFEFLRQQQPEEVNFWRPGGKSKFAAIQAGSPFLFKLHAPMNKIVGGGFFVRFFHLPLSLAWRALGLKNGAPDYWTFKNLILKYRKDDTYSDPIIGCIILASSFFLPESKWIDSPKDWAPNIVQGKTYDRASPIGKKLWDWAMQYLLEDTEDEIENELIAEQTSLYGAPQTIRPRLGQGAFRLLVTNAYANRCAISGEKTLPALEAAHIKPYPQSGPNRTYNGILLRADIHNLFDSGLLTLTNDYKVEVSRRIKEEYENGREYYKYHGIALHTLPKQAADRPAAKFIQWHNDNIFRS